MAAAADELVFAPLGGVGEIGMNLAIYGLGDERRRSWLAVDLGVSFASEEHLPGVDLILPDIRYLVEERKNLVGLVLTHAHEDHFGALHRPVAAAEGAGLCHAVHRRTARGQARGRARRAGNSGEIVPLGGRFQLGPFDIELVTMAHSIPESNALDHPHARPARCCTPATGRSIRRRSSARRPTRPSCARSARRAVLALIGDSTNAVREGRSPSEADVGQDPRRADRQRARPRRGHHIRLQCRRACARSPMPRRPATARWCVVGRAMERVVQVARETGYLDGVQEFRADGRLRLSAAGQGAWRSAPAARASRARRWRASPKDEHPEVTLSRGDRVIFSVARHSRQREGGRPRHQRPDRRRASRSSPTARIWCTCPAIRAAPSLRT